MFRDEPVKIEQNRAALLARLAEKARPKGKVVIGLKELDAAAKQLGNMFDSVHGGLRGAPGCNCPVLAGSQHQGTDGWRHGFGRRYGDLSGIPLGIARHEVQAGQGLSGIA